MEKQASPQRLTRTLAAGFLVWPQGASDSLTTSFQSANLPFLPEKMFGCLLHKDTALRALPISFHLIFITTVQSEYYYYSHSQIKKQAQKGK